MIDQGMLISAPYLEQQRLLHAGQAYGERGDRWATTVAAVADAFGATSILDYGCGRGGLVRALRAVKRPEWRLAEYDPAVTGKHGPPEFADMVVCTDVLEHIEPDRLDRVLTHISSLIRKVGFLVVSTRPARTMLPDGRNAHLTVQPDDWWQARAEAAGLTVHPCAVIPPDVKRPAQAWIAVVTP